MRKRRTVSGCCLRAVLLLVRLAAQVLTQNFSNKIIIYLLPDYLMVVDDMSLGETLINRRILFDFTPKMQRLLTKKPAYEIFGFDAVIGGIKPWLK